MSHDKYLKDRLSYRIPSLLPEYLREESPAFEAFLKAYFEFLEAEVLVLSSQSDIDSLQLEDGTGSALYESATVSPSPDEDSSKILYERTSTNPDTDADPLVVGEYLVGNTSKSVAKIEVINGNTLYLKSISGNGFASGETVTGRKSNQTAVVKSYKENSILASNRLLDYSDIDKTTEDFLDYFQQDFMPSIDLASVKNKRLTIKNIKDLYKKKGTAESVQFLMRILYQQDATIRHPIDETIHVGESGYSQQRRMRVTIPAGIPEANDKITQYDASTGIVIEAQAVIENVFVDNATVGLYSLEIMNNHVGTFTEGSNITILDRDGITAITGTVNGIISDVTTGSSTYLQHDDDGDLLLEDGAGLLLETNPNPYGSLYSLNHLINITGSKLDTDTVETKSKVNGLTEGSIKEIMIETPGINYEAGDMIVFEDGVGGNAEAIIGSTGDEMLLEGGSVFGHYEITVTAAMINNPSSGKTLIGGPGVKDDNSHYIIFNDNSVDVYVDGVLKTPTTDYTWQNDRVTFQTALTAGQLVELYTEYNRVTYEDGSVVDYNSDDGRIRSILMRDGGRFTEIPKVFPGGYIYLSDVSGFKAGEVVTGGTSTATGTISSIDTENNRLIIKRLPTHTGVFAVGEVITATPSGVTGTIIQHNVSSGTGAKLFAFSDDIGGVGSINITDQGNHFNYDGLVSGSSYFNILIKTPSANLLRDLVITGTLSGTTAKIVSYDADRHILTYRDLDGQFYDNEKVTYNVSDSFYTIKGNNFDGRGLYAGEGIIEEQIVGDYGTLNANASRVQDGLLYQTHSYVVKVGESINKWRGVVKDLLHPAGHIVFGEVAIQKNIDSAMSSIFRPIIVINAEPTYNFDLEGEESIERDPLKNNMLLGRSEIMLESSHETYVLDEDGNPTSELSHYDMRHNILLEEAPEQGAITYKRTTTKIYTIAENILLEDNHGLLMEDGSTVDCEDFITALDVFALLREAGQPAYNTDPRTGNAVSSFAMVDGIQTGEGTEMYDSMMRSRHWNINVINSFATVYGAQSSPRLDNMMSVLNIANKDYDWLVIESEQRPSDQGKVIQINTPVEEDLILEDGGLILDEPVPNYLRMDDRLAENVYHQGEFGERILGEDGSDIICLEDATTTLEITHFTTERSIELESGGLYYEDGDRVVSETEQVFIQEDMSEVGITSYVPFGSTFRSLNTITGQQTYNIAYLFKQENGTASNSGTHGDDIALEDGEPQEISGSANPRYNSAGSSFLMREDSKPEGLRMQDLTAYYPNMFIPEFENQERKRTNITYSAYIKSA